MSRSVGLLFLLIAGHNGLVLAQPLTSAAAPGVASEVTQAKTQESVKTQESAGTAVATVPSQSLPTELAQSSAPPPESRPGALDKIQQTVAKKGQPSVFGQASKPGPFAIVEQTTLWSMPGTGRSWGTGAAFGTTVVGLGLSGNISGTSDSLLTWSALLGPAFQHVYNVPGQDRTALGARVFATLSPLKGNDLNIYTTIDGLFGVDPSGENRVQGIVKTGIIYSFAQSRIISDTREAINLPERGFYARVEPAWFFAVNGQLQQAQTQLYLGLSETWYPFTFAVEVGPQFIQTARRELQTVLGSFFDFGYVIDSKTRAYVRYRPALSFGGSEYPAAQQQLAVGINRNF